MRAGRHPALAETALTPFWLEQSAAGVDPQPLLAGSTAADLVVVGGGYTGLWTALLAKERHPHLDVILLEADRVGHAASGRNGGFCSASLTHGLANGSTGSPTSCTSSNVSAGATSMRSRRP
jgi:FAD dependent oxidoreductase